MTEADFQKALTDLCDWRKLLWYHVNDSRKDRKGFPDLVIVGSRTIFVELKSQMGRVRKEQQEWIDRLALAGAEVYLWRPSDLPQALKIIKSL